MADRHFTKTATFVVLERAGHVFLIRRAHTGWNDGKWTLPSGHVDKGESVKAATVREAKEETGVTIAENDLRFLYVHYVHDSYTNFYFQAEKWDGEAVLNEPQKCSEVGWFPKQAVPEDTVRHVKEMFADTANGIQFADTLDDPGN